MIYSTATAIIAGMLWYKHTGRDPSWIIIASSFAPDFDIVAGELNKETRPEHPYKRCSHQAEGSDVVILDDLSTGKPDIDANLKQIKTSAWETVPDLHKTPMMPSILHMNDVF